MSSDIPNIDQRIISEILKGQRLPELSQSLDEFCANTGLHRGEPESEKEKIWLKAIFATSDPNAFNLDDELNGTDTDVGSTANNDTAATPATSAHPTPESDDEVGPSPNQAASNDRTGGLRLTKAEKEAMRLDREVERLETPSEEPPYRRRPVIQHNDWRKWSLPWQQWRTNMLCALGAALLGMTEAVVNPAQTFYQATFEKWIIRPEHLTVGTNDPKLIGLVNSAPYLSCIISCWLSPFFNRKAGRRGAIFWSTLFSILSPLLQASSRSLWELLLYRLLQGVGVGIKSVTIPIYIAETAPASIRGSLVMLFQVFTAAGIMLGSLTGLAFENVGGHAGDGNCLLGDSSSSNALSWACSQNWRYMLGSTVVLATLLFFFTYGCHESPRWLIAKAHRLRRQQRPVAARAYYRDAWKALKALSRHRLIAARDMLSYYYLLEQESIDLADRLEEHPRRSELVNSIFELVRYRRVGRAVLASLVCMFAQQLCGVNVIVYYSDSIFQLSRQANVDLGRDARAINKVVMDNFINNNRLNLYYTAGFGIINFIFAIPAFFLIDTVGRRSLLLCAFPFLAISHFITMTGFFIGIEGEHSPGTILAFLGISLFGAIYSFSEGPVPFVYASESMPLYCRESAMALVVSINWMFNWAVAYSGPPMLSAWGKAETFAFYGGMCIVIWFLILFLVPETRALTLEELGIVFGKIGAMEFARHSYNTLLWWLYGYRTRLRPKSLYANLPQRDRTNVPITRQLTRFERGERTHDEAGLEVQNSKINALSSSETLEAGTELQSMTK